MNKQIKIKGVFRLITAALFAVVSAPIAGAQGITGANWTAWLSVSQATCVQRAQDAAKLAGFTIVESQSWYVVGNARNKFLRIKCVADDNSTRLVNPGVSRVLAVVDVSGLTTDVSELRSVNDCFRQFILSGTSRCWPTGGGPTGTNTTQSGFTAISWRDTPQSLKLWGGNGQRYIFFCPPNGQIMPIWGSISYTQNSSICTAAVHNSRITRSSGGNVMIELDTGPIYFYGVKSAGVTSKEYRGRIRAFSFLAAPTDANAALVTIYGRRWRETEAGWTGTWTRVGYTNVFSAVWSRGNEQVKALLTMHINGNNVSIERRNSTGGVICGYAGTLSSDRRTVSGTYSCTRNGAAYVPRTPWQATIER